MGGDGGTLNNSRREHTRLRREILGPGAVTAAAKSRASVRTCAVSKEPLQPPHVVADWSGVLYNKEALVSCLLVRARRGGGALAHVRMLARDTAVVRGVGVGGTLVCPVTRKTVTEEGRFGLGWRCGCVTASVDGVDGVGESGGEGDGHNAQNTVKCPACGVVGERVMLGMTLQERSAALQAVRDQRVAEAAARKTARKEGRKRAKRDNDELAGTETQDSSAKRAAK